MQETDDAIYSFELYLLKTETDILIFNKAQKHTYAAQTI